VPDSLIEAAAQLSNPVDRRIYGVAPAEVIANTDSRGEGRVQLKLPWLPGYEPWARVAMPMAGSDRGMFFIPQVGDEVLVAFGQGDVRDPFVVGSLWNGRDDPPATGMTDPVAKRVIKTPAGHVLTFDDAERSIEVETADGQRLVMDAQKIELDAGSGAAKLTLEASGNVTIKATAKLEASGSTVKVDGTATAEVHGASLDLKGDATCAISAGIVRVN
jgi:uncharacterized protein involved in type VI secretion and phage assembly